MGFSSLGFEPISLYEIIEPQQAKEHQQQRYWQLSNRRHRPELSVHRLGWLIASTLDPPIGELLQIIQHWSKTNAALQF